MTKSVDAISIGTNLSSFSGPQQHRTAILVPRKRTLSVSHVFCEAS